jgi:rhodanese-related sulfurtransferase
MKKLLLLLLFGSLLFAEFRNIEVTPGFFDQKIKVVDIRTPGEWKQTGIIKGAYTIMFFDERGGYDSAKFVAQLNQVVRKDEPFALICRTGNRTSMIAPMLSSEFGYNVINLQGGMVKLIKEGYVPAPYSK